MVYRHNQIVKKEISKLLLFGLAAILSLSILSTTAKRADAIAPSCSFTPSGSVDTLNDDCYVSSRYTVPAGRTLDGDGHTMYPNFANPLLPGNPDNATLEIDGDNITVKNLTIDGSSGTDLHGINIYEADNVTIDNVTVINNDHSGIVVNSSTVSVSNVTTASNGWHGINVDQKTSEPSVLNITGPMHQTDTFHILVDDITKNVTINDNLSQYVYATHGIIRIYTLDTTAPTTPTIIAPTDGQSFPTQPIYDDWTDSTDDSGIIDKYEIEYVYDDGHTFAGGPYRETPGTQSWRNHTPALWEQGGVTIRVRAYDPAGNMSGWSNSVHYYYDYEAPSVPVLTSPIGYTNDNTPLMQWEDSTDASGIAGYYYRVYYNCSDEGNVPASCASLYPNTTGVWRTISEYQAGTTSDGTYFWQVMAKDNAGNQSAWSGLEKVVIDTVAPEKVDGMSIWQNSVDLGCYPYVNNRTITVNWDNSTDVNFDYYRYQADANMAAPYDFTTTLTPSERTGMIRDLDGTYHYRVQAVDKAGNTGPWSDWCGVTLDRVIPTMTSINMFVSTDGGATYTDKDFVKPGDMVRVEVEAEDLGSGIKDVEYRAKRSGAAGYIAPRTYIATPDHGNVYFFDFTVPTDGKYIDLHTPISEAFEDNVAWARATDMAGNYHHGIGNLFTFDNTKPTNLITFPSNGDVLRNDFVITGDSADAGSDIDRVEIDITVITAVGGSYVSTVVSDALATYDSGTDTYAFDTDPFDLPDGIYRLKAQAFDNVGNWKYHYVDVVVDNTPPLTSALTSPVDTSVWGTPITITGETADLNGVDFVKIYYRTAGTADPFVLAGVSPVDNTANDSPFAWTIDWTPPTDGIYDIKAGGVDIAGNEEASVYAYDVTYDTTDPSTVNAGADRGNQSTPFSQTGTADDGSGSGIASTIWNKTSGPGNVLATGGNTLTPTFSADADGAYIVRLTATDNAGNSAYDEFSFTWVTPAPATPPQTLGAIDRSGSGSSGTGGTSPFVAVTNLEPTNTPDNDGQVEGDQDKNDDGQGEVLQATNTDGEQSEVTEGCFEILGVCWYWWLLVVPVIGLIWWMMTRDDEEEPTKKK